MPRAWSTQRKALYLLLPNQHFPSGGKIAGSQCVEINTARNRLAECVASIPIRGTAPIGVIASPLITQIQLAHQRTVDVVNRDSHIGFIRQPIRDPCLRIERIWIVHQQGCLHGRWRFGDLRRSVCNIHISGNYPIIHRYKGLDTCRTLKLRVWLCSLFPFPERSVTTFAGTVNRIVPPVESSGGF